MFNDAEYTLDSIMKKRVVHVTYDMHIGGAEKVIANLVKYTDNELYDVSVYCLEKSVGLFGLTLIQDGFEVTSSGRRSGLDIQLISKLRHYIKAKKIDIVHAHQYTPFVYSVFASVGCKTKVIFTEHGRFFPDKKRLKRFLLNPFLNILTHSVTAISSATKDALVKYENFPPKAIKVIYNGIEDPQLMIPDGKVSRDDFDISADAIVLGAVSRLDVIKNHELMLAAISKSRAFFGNIILLIVGDGPERKKLEKLTVDLDLTDIVIFTGFREDAASLYRIMDIFLLPSFSEGTAMTLLEAMAARVPSVVSDVGGNPEIIIDGKSGLIFPSNDLVSFCQKLALLCESKERRIQMGEDARLSFEQRFTVDCMVGEYQKIYSLC